MSNAADSLHQTGLALHNAGRFAEALATFDQALTSKPHSAKIHYSRGNTLAMMNRAGEAIAAYDACLAVDPSQASAHYNRATMLVRMQGWAEALFSLDRALACKPDMAEAWNNRAGVLQAMGRHAEALDSIMRVLDLRPFDAQAFYNAGIMLLPLNRFDEARDVFRRAVELKPDHHEAWGCLAAAALRACDWECLERAMPMVSAALAAGRSSIPPLSMLALTDDPLLQRRSAEVSTRRLLEGTELGEGSSPAALWTGEPYRHVRLRVGYLSADFRAHPVGMQIGDLLECHDRRRFEIIALSIGTADDSPARRRIISASDSFHDLGGISNLEAAKRIRALEVDILVDLNGQTLGWRPAILKYRPAPVNVTYFGYAGTTGADFIDYILGDDQVTPLALAPAFSEKIVQLRRTFWPAAKMPVPEAASRKAFGLPEQDFVFCCFNSVHKIRPELFDVWMRVLKAVPQSVLWLRDSSPSVNARLCREAENRGVPAARLIFAGRTESFARHLGRHALADLFLDTFPYNAHVTAVDALWGGLPLLSMQGGSMVSRVAASFLHLLDLPDLVVHSLGEYEEKAVALALNPQALGDIRARLAQGRQSAFFRTPDFARDLEAAYQRMLDQAQGQRAGEPIAPSGRGSSPF